MKKLNINGRDYIKLSELRHEIKRIRDGARKLLDALFREDGEDPETAL